MLTPPSNTVCIHLLQTGSAEAKQYHVTRARASTPLVPPPGERVRWPLAVLAAVLSGFAMLEYPPSRRSVDCVHRVAAERQHYHPTRCGNLVMRGPLGHTVHTYSCFSFSSRASRRGHTAWDIANTAGGAELHHTRVCFCPDDASTCMYIADIIVCRY